MFGQACIIIALMYAQISRTICCYRYEPVIDLGTASVGVLITSLFGPIYTVSGS